MKDMAEGARFEAPKGSVIISPDLVQSVSNQSLTEEPELDEDPIKPRRIR